MRQRSWIPTETHLWDDLVWAQFSGLFSDRILSLVILWILLTRNTSVGLELGCSSRENKCSPCVEQDKAAAEA